MKAKQNLTLIAVLAAGLMGGWAFHEHNTHSVNTVLQSNAMPLVRTGFSGTVAAPDFEKAAQSSVPAVVHIKTLTKFKQTSGSQRQQDPFGGMFGDDELYKRFFGGGGGGYSQPDQRASGSGVIISNDGYIVTNNHVVDGANELTVTLNNRKDYKAKVIGADPNTDLALVKIDAKDLPTMPVGNSDEAHLGQWVLAVGYPLNLDVTVTQGIISAKSRAIGINRTGAAPVEAFIQTDAAVNPGSSGGALINANGELIGINAAIASPTGSYAGYAYAIPSNLMKKVIGDIMKFGAVQRGFLGISMGPDNTGGVTVVETDANGAAAEAGIKKGDAITKIDGQAIETGAQLAEQVARHKPGDQMAITFVRGNEEKTVTATLKNKSGVFASQESAAFQSLGGEFEAVKGGVQVSAINDGVLADQTNMKPGFIIMKVGGIMVKNVEELKAAIAKQGANFQLQGVYPGSSEVYYYGINDFR